MYVEKGTEALKFPEKEYINGIFVAVQTYFTKLSWILSSLASWYLKSLYLLDVYEQWGPHQPPQGTLQEIFQVLVLF